VIASQGLDCLLLDQGDLAYRSGMVRVEPRSLVIAVALEASARDGPGVVHADHRLASAAGDVDGDDVSSVHALAASW
jgi:hypothetical protein